MTARTSTTAAATGASRRRRPTVDLVLGIAMLAGCTSTATPPTAHVRIVSDPPGALATMVPADTDDRSRLALGLTPVETTVGLPAGGVARVTVEKRGFEAQTLAVGPGTGPLSVVLRATGGPTGPAPEIAHATVLGVVGPEVELIRRGFAHEEVSQDGSAAAGDAIAAAIATSLAGRVAVRRLAVPEAPAALLRDVAAAAALADPVRLPFQQEAPRLQSAAGRRAAAEAGERLETRALLVVSGRSSVEAGGMKAGKLGIMVAGTAASYGAASSGALAGGHDSFVYTVYLPAATGGTRLDAVLVDARTAEVLWVNRGLYPPLDPERPERTAEIVADLLTGMPAATAASASNPRSEGGA